MSTRPNSFKLSGFGDEISSNLDEQLSVLEEEGIKYLELRSIEGKNILDLEEKKIKEIKKKLDRRGFKVSCLASPVGKTSINEPFLLSLEKFKKALNLAILFNTKYIRIFSYYIPYGKEPEKFREEIIKRMREKASLAAQKGIILLHENDQKIYGDIPIRCEDILKTVNSPYLKAAFDPANFIQVGIRPFQEAFWVLLPYIQYVHVKDALLKDGKVVLPGKGDGEIDKILQELKKRGFSGFLSLEPHLVIAGKAGGFSGRENFRKAVGALREILEKI